MAYRMTAARRAALKKAQIASARKRKGRGRKIAKGVAIAGGVAAVGTAIYVGKSTKQQAGRSYARKAA